MSQSTGAVPCVGGSLTYWGRRLRRYLLPLALQGIAAGMLLAYFVIRVLTDSLPPLNGTFAAAVSAPVQIHRDAQGIVTIDGQTRRDVAFGLGFAHAQDRLFQMDLLRRLAAGELSELLGPAALTADRDHRRYRFRARCTALLAELSLAERELLDAYTQGVEAGRQTLARLPWEYLLLQADFSPWQSEDTLLVLASMFVQLQNLQPGIESARLLLRDLLSPAMADFLNPRGSSWDAPLEGEALPLPPLPRPADVPRDPVAVPRAAWNRPANHSQLQATADSESVSPGSNNWAVAGKRSRHGGAMVACDMHLMTRVPTIWYRAVMRWGERQLVGATLPGTPALIVGSTGRLAWGFTNSEVDSADLIVSDEPGTIYPEEIRVKGQASVWVEIEETAQGTVWDRDHLGRRRVLRWVPLRPGGMNLRLMALEEVDTVREAIALASKIGIPTQNFVVADRHGAIAWALMGRLPNRVGERWDGWLAQGPRLLEPEEGILWTANNRTYGGDWLDKLGEPNFDHGARAMQIRDNLRQRPVMDEADLLAIQLDDRALFLRRWRDLLLREATNHPHALAAQTVAAIQAWRGRAVPESVGYRLVKEFRARLRQELLSSWCARALRADRRFNFRQLNRNLEGPIWEVLEQRPEHLLPSGYESWDSLFAGVLKTLQKNIRDLPRHTLAEQTTPRITHPLSAALGPLAGVMRLDMTPVAMPGDETALPRIQGPVHMASQRMAVSPGREAEGYFHMPTGQSGHFLSPFYRAGHDDWATGRMSPLLPGPPRYTLTLTPREP
ncbi:MAG: penicillin acylase family protein [Gemmataceae bacterium]